MIVHHVLLLFHAFAVIAAGTATDTANAALPPPSALPRRQQLACSQIRRRVVQLDLERLEKRRPSKREGVEASTDGQRAIGLGDALDITYNVLVQVGNMSTPLVLGSADLWVLSDSCSMCSSSSFPLYPSRNLKYVADAQLLYGDSRTGTHASGVIGTDRVGVAGLVLEEQYFAAINDTDTSVLDTGSVGIFGLGFPVNSILWNELYAMAALNPASPTLFRRISSREDMHLRQRPLPIIPFFPPQNLAVEEDVTDGSSIASQVDILSSFATYGPFVSRLVLNSSLEHEDDDYPPLLASPQFSVTLQRTIPNRGGNIGALTLGGLPNGVDNASLAWIPVRRYKGEQNGMVVPQAAKETYPYTWDVPLDSVYFDGVLLPGSALGDVSLEGVGQSALIDTGNSLIRGPADVVVAILSLLANSRSSPSPFFGPSPPLDGSKYTANEYAEFTENFDSLAYAYPCEEAHSLSFEFSGKRFPVDPRDFGRPIGDPEARWCVPNLAPTDAPKIGDYLYSWSLGEPFLRGVLASFFYGNLTHPSSDPPRIGFLSTVPEDATLRLTAAVRFAESLGSYPETTVSVPTGTHSLGAVSTDVNGVVRASEPALPFDPTLSSASGSVNGRSGRHKQGSSTSGSCCSSFRPRPRNHALVLLCLILAVIWIFV